MDRSRNQTGLIPDRLLNDVKKGDRVLFLGADLPLEYPNAPLSRPELAAALAEKHDLPRGKSWPQTATAYLSTFHNDRHGLVTFVREHGYGPQVAPGPIHRAIAQVGFRAIVTAWYDQLLEQTLRDAGYTVNRVVRDVQLPYAQEGEREVIVVKLYGCLSDPESLVLDVWDREELTEYLSRKLELATAFCSIRPPLFVGFDLLDRRPINLYVRASRNMAEHMRRAYAIWPHDLASVEGAWYGKNVEFRRADATAFLEALAVQLPPVRVVEEKAKRIDRPPYKFLDYYEADDADIFCGRDTESQIVTRLALSHRLLTLFGPSGAGKTSLLLAGVVPQLAAWDYQHVYVRALDDPLPALRRAIAARAGKASSPITGDGPGETLREFLNAALAPGDRLVVILDQFEELFIRVGSRARDAFFAQLAAVLDEPERDVRVLFSLREDYVAYLDEAREHLPDVFGNSFRLTSLDRANARVAVSEPAARTGVTVEPALVDALVGAEGRAGDSVGALVEVDDHVTRVFPAALQIVLDRLYRDALPDDYNPHDPPPEGLTLTLDAYRAIEHVRQREGEEPQVLCGAEAILAGYVGDAVVRLSELGLEDADGTPLGADPDLGREVLKVLVTGQATKAALTRVEMEGRLEEAGALRCDDRRDMALLDATLLGLQWVRLLRSFEREGAAYYELTHDTLAKEVATWIGEEEMQLRVAREILRRSLDNWRHAELLIPPEALELIHACCEDLRRLDAEELELLFRSALAAGYEAVYWFERARQGGVDVDEIALAGLRGDNWRARTAAVVALGQLGERFVEPIMGMLADDYPQVRVAAIAVLERLRPDGAWREHLKYECYVPAGEFIMGDDQMGSNERPAHKVYLDAFYIGKYPVTNAEYKRYKDGVRQPFEMPMSKVDHPVVNITWYDARDYAAWAGMRLLTEAEWEKAASWDEGRREGVLGLAGKRGKKRLYPWGDPFDKDKCATRESWIGGTTPVGKYSPSGDSPYGCADMAGNVGEWTSSLYENYPYQADDGREDMASSGNRVLRGGSFSSSVELARSAYRDLGHPVFHFGRFGVRVGVAAPFSLPSGL